MQPALESTKFHITVIGPGALGSLFATRLSLAGISTTLLDYRHERAALLQQRGIRLCTQERELTVYVPVTADPRILTETDAALILVKAYRTEEIATLLQDHLSPNAIAVTLQNGLGNVETLQLHLGQQRVFGGTTAQAALLTAMGVVQDTGNGPTILGTLSHRADARLDDVCQALMTAGFSVSITTDLTAALWHKVILNAAINAVGALTRLRNGQLGQHEPSLQLMTAACAGSSPGSPTARCVTGGRGLACTPARHLPGDGAEYQLDAAGCLTRTPHRNRCHQRRHHTLCRTLPNRHTDQSDTHATHQDAGEWI